MVKASEATDGCVNEWIAWRNGERKERYGCSNTVLPDANPPAPASTEIEYSSSHSIFIDIPITHCYNWMIKRCGLIQEHEGTTHFSSGWRWRAPGRECGYCYAHRDHIPQEARMTVGVTRTSRYLDLTGICQWPALRKAWESEIPMLPQPQPTLCCEFQHSTSTP